MARAGDSEAVVRLVRNRKRKRAERRRRRRRNVVVVLVVSVVLAVGIVVAGFGATAAFSESCSLSSLKPVNIGANTFVYAADGSFLGSIPADRNRSPVALKRMSAWLPAATVSVEDRRFYEHGGIDYVGIARAMWTDLSAGKVVEGGSTITQQLVRNMYTGREQTLDRKIKEACLAIKLSDRWSKARILQTYLNTVYYGNHAYGVEAAAETYFSRHARNLNLAQAALIAGLPQAPSIYDPLVNPKAALIRRKEVLRAMLTAHAITRKQFRWAVKQKLQLKPGRIYTRIKQPYFFSYVIDELEDVYGANVVRDGGLRVYTTIEPRLQVDANSAIRETLDESDDPAAAIVSVTPGTGAIRAMTAVIPGKKHNEFNLTSQSARQAGSTFKTFVLTAAIEKGIDPNNTYYDLGAVHLHDRAVVHRRLQGRQAVGGDHLRPHLCRLDLDHERDSPLRQHGLRAAHTRRRARHGLQAGAEAGRELRRPEARRLDRARFALGLARSTWQPPTPPSPPAGSTRSRPRSGR